MVYASCIYSVLKFQGASSSPPSPSPNPRPHRVTYDLADVRFQCYIYVFLLSINFKILKQYHKGASSLQHMDCVYCGVLTTQKHAACIVHSHYESSVMLEVLFSLL